MYLGLTGAVLGTIPTAAIYFGVYEWCKGRLESRGWCATFPNPLTAFAAFCQFVSPSETKHPLSIVVAALLVHVQHIRNVQRHAVIQHHAKLYLISVLASANVTVTRAQSGCQSADYQI